MVIQDAMTMMIANMTPNKILAVLVSFNFLLILMYTSYCHYTITLRNFVPSNDIYNKRDKNGTI